MVEYNSSRTLDHSYVVLEILKREQSKIFAEIGVWIAKTTRKILRAEVRGEVPNLEEYWAVDPWVMMTGSYDGENEIIKTHWNNCVEAFSTEEEWFRKYWYCCRLMTYFPGLKVLRMTSEEAVSIFPNGYFDMVFLDAIHTFDHMYADIGYWLPKVRKGGLIGGHDYGHKAYTGVKEAVDKWFDGDIEVWKRGLVWVKRV